MPWLLEPGFASLVQWPAGQRPHVRGGSEGFPDSSVGEESTYNAGDLGSIPGWGRSPGKGNGNPLQHSCLGNPNGMQPRDPCLPWRGKLGPGHTLR